MFTWTGCAITQPAVAQTPLPELGSALYQVFEGGLYPGGVNAPPEAHLDSALAAAAEVTPRDSAGRPDADGWIVWLAIGMSNATQEFAAFERQADADPRRNPRVVLLNGALGGQTASTMADPESAYWGTVDGRLSAMYLTPAQVQVVWLKNANAQPPDDFPGHAERLRDDLADVARNIRRRFVNVKLCYVSSRTYGGYSDGPLNPEPQAYESGFAVKWLIERQISGDPALRFDSSSGEALAPLLLWGPYLWANGSTPRTDGLAWIAADVQSDETHPSASGERKVADLLQAFVERDETVRSWYAENDDLSLTAIDASDDATVKAEAPSASFGGERQLVAWGGAREERALLRFDLGNQVRPVAMAKLSLRVASQGGSELHALRNAAWSEDSVTYADVSRDGGGVLTIIPESTDDSTIAVDVTEAVNADADGVVAFAIQGRDGFRAAFASRESGEPPRLILVTSNRSPTPRPPTRPSSGCTVMPLWLVMTAGSLVGIRIGKTHRIIPFRAAGAPQRSVGPLIGQT